LPKNSAFLTENKANFLKKLTITLVFEKNANFFAENCQKSQKIVIITSNPGHPASANVCLYIGRLFALGSLLKNTEAADIFWTTACFLGIQKLCIHFHQQWVLALFSKKKKNNFMINFFGENI
jgi:hypothetical protein